MPETFSTRQSTAIASSTKTIYWEFRVADTIDNVYYWSTGTVPSVGDETFRSAPFRMPPGVWMTREWNRAHTFKIINFSGITLRRGKTESGIHAPNDVSFTIVNSSNTYTAANFRNGEVRIALVIDDGIAREVCGSWRFRIKSASPFNQQIDVVCEDFLQQYLLGSYPNMQLINEIFPNTYDASKQSDNICVPEPYGTCYIPLRPVYATDDRYYLLGDTVNTYTISKVRSPRSMGSKVEWSSGSFTFTQSTKADAGANNWRVFQPIIADSDLDGTVDSNGVWLNGSGLLDMPTQFSRSDTVSMTSPADIIKTVLHNMGVSDYDLNLDSFDAAKVTYASWGLEWNFAFWYKQDRVKVLSNLLAMCHSCLIVGERIKLQVLSKTSQLTIDETNVTMQSESGPPNFQYSDTIAEGTSDSAYVAWQQTNESQDEFLRALVPAKSATDYVDSEVLTIVATQDSQEIQKLGTLYYQRKFLKIGNVSSVLKGTALAIRPDDVATVDYADFGGTYNVLVDEVQINEDAAVSVKCLKFSETLDDWEDLVPGAITVGTDTTSNAYQPVIAGPDAIGATNLPNALPGRLRVGQTSNYILLEPVASSTRISLYSSDVERMRFGNLNGFLDYVTNLYGMAIGDASNYLKYDPTNGLRISGAISAGTIDIGGADTTSFHVDANGNMWLGAAAYNITTNPFAVSNAGVLRAVSGTIGGFTLATTTLIATNLTLDSANQKITLGTGTDIISLDAADVTYRLAIGHSTYASAPFRVTKAGLVTATSGTVGGWTLSATNLSAGTDADYIGLSITDGIQLGDSTFADAKFSVTPAGVLKSISGIIGGFTLSSTALYAGAVATRIQLDTTSGIHLGATAFADAPFKVSLAGALIATNATISGTISAATIDIGGADATSFHVDIDGNIWSGAAAFADGVFKVSNAGALTATSATITGAINATSGKFGTATNYWSVGATGLTATSASTDVIINYGKNDFTNVDAGFILGYDFSALAAKFLIGDATSYLNWDGSALTFTKGTLAESIIQMYTNVATLKTSATAGDGSMNSAGIVVTYEGLFGCGANQTSTVAAANANVRILADGSASFSGMVRGSYLYGSSLMTKGSYLSVSCSAADATLNVGDTTDFAASGTAYFIDSSNDRDAFTYAGKTTTTLTGCSGVLAHTVSASNRPLVAPVTKGMYISDAANEIRFFGDRGDGTIEVVASIGNATAAGLFPTFGWFGSANAISVGLVGQSKSNAGIIGVSTDLYGIQGTSTNSYGVYGYSVNSYSLFSAGTTYLTSYTIAVGGLRVGTTATDPGDNNFYVEGTSDFAGISTFTNTGLHILDTNASHDLIIKPGSDLSADHTLTLTTGNADRTLTIDASCTLNDWFDQSVKQAASPTFAAPIFTSLKASGAEQLKFWTYTHTVTAAEAASDTWSQTVTAVTLAKVRSLQVVANISGVGLSTGLGTFWAVRPTYMADTTTVNGSCEACAENDIISITIIEAV